MAFSNWFFPSTREISFNGLRFEITYQENGGTIGYIDILSIPIFAQGLNVLSSDISQIPLKVYLKTANGRVRVNSKLDTLLNGQPNGFQNSSQFWRTVGIQMITGECFVSTRNDQLVLLPRDNTCMYQTPSGERRFAVTYTRQELVSLGFTGMAGPVVKDDFAWNEVLHFYQSMDEFGFPIPVRARFRSFLQFASDHTKYMIQLYNRGGTVTGYLTTDQKVPVETRKGIIAGFKQLLKGKLSEKEQQIAALDNGWKFSKLDLSPQEMQLLESKKDLNLDICRVLNIPPSKVGILDSYKYATVESASREYLQSSLNPLLVQIESEVNAKLLADYETASGMYCEFDRDTFVSIDTKTMAEVDDIALKNGGMSISEWRQRRNLPVKPEDDIRQIAVNMQSASYLAANEALKLQLSQLDVQIKAEQLKEMQHPPAPPPPNPPEPPPPPAVVDVAANLRSIQAEYVAAMPADAWKDHAAVEQMVTAIAGEVAAIHGLDASQLETRAYSESLLKRCESPDIPHEINRCVNAMNHQSILATHGVNVLCRWVGGEHDGECRKISDTWDGSKKHPPFKDTNSFLVLEKR